MNMLGSQHMFLSEFSTFLLFFQNVDTTNMPGGQHIFLLLEFSLSCLELFVKIRYNSRMNMLGCEHNFAVGLAQSCCNVEFWKLLDYALCRPAYIYKYIII